MTIMNFPLPLWERVGRGENKFPQFLTFNFKFLIALKGKNMPGRRIERMNEFLREEVAMIIQRELMDPRIGFVTVLSSDITHDLKEAKVFVSVIGDEKQKKRSMKGLQRAAGFIQEHFAKVVEWRNIPKITFHLDETEEKASKVEFLLKKIKASGNQE